MTDGPQGPLKSKKSLAGNESGGAFLRAVWLKGYRCWHDCFLELCAKDPSVEQISYEKDQEHKEKRYKATKFSGDHSHKDPGDDGGDEAKNAQPAGSALFYDLHFRFTLEFREL